MNLDDIGLPIWMLHVPYNTSPKALLHIVIAMGNQAVTKISSYLKSPVLVNVRWNGKAAQWYMTILQ